MGLYDNSTSQAGGLLGALQDPQTQMLLSLGAGLLQAGGPSTRPVSFGQALSGGLMSSVQAMNDAQERQQKQQMAVEQLKMLKLQEQRAQGMFDMQKQAFNDVDGAPSQTSMPGQLGGAMNGAASLSAGAQSAPQASAPNSEAELRKLQKLAILGVPGAKELFDIYKYKTDGIKRDPGSIIDHPGGGREFIPDVKSGIGGYDFNSNTMTPVGGYTDFQAGLEGKKTAAVEAAKAPYNTTTLNLPGGPRVVSNANLPDILSGPAGLDLSKVSPEQRAGLAQLLKSGQLDTEAFQRGVDHFSQTSNQGPGIALENKDRTAVINDLAKNRLSGLEKEAQSQQDILSKLSIAERLIQQGTYGNGLVDRLGMAGQSTGLYTTPTGENTNLLKQIGNQLVLARGSLGAGVSNADAERYDRAAGDFNNAQSNSQRMKAIGIMREIAGPAFNAANQARNQYAKDGTLPDFEAPQKQGQAATPNLLTELPTANRANAGKMAVDHDTGKRYRSNGLQWVEVK